MSQYVTSDKSFFRRQVFRNLAPEKTLVTCGRSVVRLEARSSYAYEEKRKEKMPIICHPDALSSRDLGSRYGPGFSIRAGFQPPFAQHLVKPYTDHMYLHPVVVQLELWIGRWSGCIRQGETFSLINQTAPAGGARGARAGPGAPRAAAPKGLWSRPPRESKKNFSSSSGAVVLSNKVHFRKRKKE